MKTNSVLRIAAKIKTLKKRGDFFTVESRSERSTALREVKAMKRYGVFDLDVTTRQDPAKGVWKVIVI